jgi:hypothetical protein
MTSTQTTTTAQNSSTATGPFDQIQELELREKARVDKELSAMAKEKDESLQATTKREEQATDELKVEAKKELKKHSETELSGILMNAKNEATSECETLESTSNDRMKAAVTQLVDKASKADTLFSTTA